MNSSRQRIEAAQRRPAGRGERGQAMMEFAFVLTLFLALMAGILEFGRVWSAANVINAAARDGARLAAITDTNNQRSTKVKARVEASAASYFAANDLTVQTKPGKGAGNEPIVTVTASGKLNLLFGNWLLGKQVTLARAMTMRDETQVP